MNAEQSHDYTDGIKENTANPPPRYFMVLLYSLIIWAIFFSGHYLFTGWSSTGEFAEKMAAHQSRVTENR